MMSHGIAIKHTFMDSRDIDTSTLFGKYWNNLPARTQLAKQVTVYLIFDDDLVKVTPSPWYIICPPFGLLQHFL